MTSGGRGVSEILTKPDMGEGGLTNDKKDILLQLQQIHKQEYPTFEFVMIFYGTKASTC